MATQNLAWYPSKIKDCYRVTPFNVTDSRGAFCKPYSWDNFVHPLGTRCDDKQFPVPFSAREVYYSYSRKDVLRGLHIQKNTSKLVTCQKGYIQDVVVDLRADSPTYMEWCDFFLHQNESVFVPEGCAHGFKTCTSSIVLYVCSDMYDQKYDTGIRYDDPDIGIEWSWPNSKVIISSRDKQLPYFKDWRKSYDAL